jgi:large subunit ribosomal protein L18
MANINRKNSRNKSRARVRSKISGSPKKPRLAVFRSLKGIYAQVIDDSQGKVLAAARLKETKEKNTMEGAGKTGKLIAEKCLKIKISEVVFDRGGYKYHGKIKALAEGARAGGLKF